MVGEDPCIVMCSKDILRRLLRPKGNQVLDRMVEHFGLLDLHLPTQRLKAWFAANPGFLRGRRSPECEVQRQPASSHLYKRDRHRIFSELVWPFRMNAQIYQRVEEPEQQSDHAKIKNDPSFCHHSLYLQSEVRCGLASGSFRGPCWRDLHMPWHVHVCRAVRCFREEAIFPNWTSSAGNP